MSFLDNVAGAVKVAVAREKESRSAASSKGSRTPLLTPLPEAQPPSGSNASLRPPPMPTEWGIPTSAEKLREFASEVNSWGGASQKAATPPQQQFLSPTVGAASPFTDVSAIKTSTLLEGAQYSTRKVPPLSPVNVDDLGESSRLPTSKYTPGTPSRLLPPRRSPERNTEASQGAIPNNDVVQHAHPANLSSFTGALDDTMALRAKLNETQSLVRQFRLRAAADGLFNQERRDRERLTRDHYLFVESLSLWSGRLRGVSEIDRQRTRDLSEFNNEFVAKARKIVQSTSARELLAQKETIERKPIVDEAMTPYDAEFSKAFRAVQQWCASWAATSEEFRSGRGAILNEQRQTWHELLLEELVAREASRRNILVTSWRLQLATAIPLLAAESAERLSIIADRKEFDRATAPSMESLNRRAVCDAEEDRWEQLIDSCDKRGKLIVSIILAPRRALQQNESTDRQVLVLHSNVWYEVMRGRQGTAEDELVARSAIGQAHAKGLVAVRYTPRLIRTGSRSPQSTTKRGIDWHDTQKLFRLADVAHKNSATLPGTTAALKLTHLCDDDALVLDAFKAILRRRKALPRGYGTSNALDFSEFCDFIQELRAIMVQQMRANGSSNTKGVESSKAVVAEHSVPPTRIPEPPKTHKAVPVAAPAVRSPIRGAVYHSSRDQPLTFEATVPPEPILAKSAISSPSSSMYIAGAARQELLGELYRDNHFPAIARPTPATPYYSPSTSIEIERSSHLAGTLSQDQVNRIGTLYHWLQRDQQGVSYAGIQSALKFPASNEPSLRRQFSNYCDPATNLISTIEQFTAFLQPYV